MEGNQSCPPLSPIPGDDHWNLADPVRIVAIIDRLRALPGECGGRIDTAHTACCVRAIEVKAKALQIPSLRSGWVTENQAWHLEGWLDEAEDSVQ